MAEALPPVNGGKVGKEFYIDDSRIHSAFHRDESFRGHHKVSVATCFGDSLRERSSTSPSSAR